MKQPEKLPNKIIDLLLPRLQDEFDAYYFYRAASNWCKNVGYFKAADYFKKESEDELTHAKKLEDFLVDWNVLPELPSIVKPSISFSDIGDLIEQSYTIEYELYESYEKTSSEVFKTGDLCVFDFLEFFRTTQKNAVAEYSDMMNVLNGVDEKDKFKILVLEETLFGE